MKARVKNEGVALAFSYMTAGLRRYGAFPVPPQPRWCWEVQAVLKGAARPWAPDKPKSPSSRHPRLYCFPPDSAHGWTAPREDLSEVLVFHIRPAALTAEWRDWMAVRPEGMRLRETDILRLRTLFDWMFPHVVQPDASSPALMRAGAALLCDAVRQAGNPWRKDDRRAQGPAAMVHAATRLYRQDLLAHPTVDDIARGVGLSASQLRRVFAAAGSMTPDQVFRSVRMDYARRLLTGSQMSVAQVGEELGYNSPSAFTRAFKAYYEMSPRAVRKRDGQGLPYQ